MEALGQIKGYAKEHKKQFGSEYEYISETIYMKEARIFDNIYKYLLCYSDIMKISVDDPTIRDILKNSQEIDLDSGDYEKVLSEWIDKYTEDAMVRLKTITGNKCYVSDGYFKLTRDVDSYEEKQKRIFNEISNVQGTASGSIEKVFLLVSDSANKVKNRVKGLAAFF